MKRFRTEFNLSQREVAEAMDVVLPLYQKYEWQKVMPPAQAIIDVATKFNVSADYLLGLSDEAHPRKFDAEEVDEAFALRDALEKVFSRLKK